MQVEINDQEFGVIEAIYQRLKVQQSKVTRISAGQDLQAAIDVATAGETIILESGATFGHINIPASASQLTIKAETMAILKGTVSAPTLTMFGPSRNVVFENIDITNGVLVNDIVRVGTGNETMAEELPHGISFLNVGIVGGENEVARALTANGNFITVDRCRFTNIRRAYSESKAILMWNSPGNLVVRNSVLEAAGVNVMIGGADAKLGYVPANLLFELNVICKNPEWRTSGINYVVKNLFELKNGKNVAIRGNQFHTHWASSAGGAGYAFWFKSVNQDGNAPFSEVRDVDFEDNDVWDIGSGFNLHYGPQNAAIPMENVRIKRNQITINRSQFGGTGRFINLNGVHGLEVESNLVTNDGNETIFIEGDPCQRFKLIDNDLVDNAYGIKGSGYGEGNATLNYYFPNAIIEKNRIRTNNPNWYPVGQTV